MQLNNLSRWGLALMGIMGLALSVLVTFLLVFNQVSYGFSKYFFSPIVSMNTVVLSEDANFGVPASIKIPKIKVDAVVVPVGLTTEGAMDVPKDPAEVAWFGLGPRPGQIGSAVVSGHYGWKNNIPAVFDQLHKLEVGDKIYIKDERGKTTVFVVKKFRRYGDKEAAPEVFASSDGKAHLNLVTCEGVWNKAEKSYSKRLVVFAEQEGDGLVQRIIKTMVAAVASVWR